MSIPNFPTITPFISIPIEQTIPLLLTSIALEELALAHIMNVEAEKLQFVLGTLDTAVTFTPAEVSIEDLLDVNTSVQRTLRDVIKKEMLLEFKFENVLELISVTPGTPETEPCGCRVTGPAGGPFDISRGTGNAITTLNGNDVSGNVDYMGLFCQNCSSDDNFFTYNFTALGANPPLPDFEFNADSFTVPNCPGDQTVTISGQGTITGTNVFGTNPSYVLTLIEENFIQLIISGNGNIFTSTVTNVGLAEMDLSNCP
ncbi:hypothetical protein [Neobacillus niacini]|uniref:hypothetical protein n=1 Tax=Neobacillus niacini TaxID=86668 RepID=UPI00333EA3A7